MIVNTPYLQVQAIRRRFRDAGRNTYARPFVYVLPVAIAGTAAGDHGFAALTIDADSDFIWLSSYWMITGTIPWDPLAPGNGQDLEELSELSRSDRQVRIENLRTGKVISRPQFLPLVMFDRGQANTGQKGSECSVAYEGEIAGQEPVTLGIWRHYWPEPIVLYAGQQVGVTVRALAGTLFPGNVMSLAGVRLSPAGG